eukprot:scaffold84517_cov55-Phaeocystis_antarctica.AAC.2
MGSKYDAVADAEVVDPHRALEAFLLRLTPVARRARIAQHAAVALGACRLVPAETDAWDLALPDACLVCAVLRERCCRPEALLGALLGLGLGLGSGLRLGLGLEALLRAVEDTARTDDAVGHAVSELAVVEHAAIAALGVASAGVPAGRARTAGTRARRPSRSCPEGSWCIATPLPLTRCPARTEHTRPCRGIPGRSRGRSARTTSGRWSAGTCRPRTGRTGPCYGAPCSTLRSTARTRPAPSAQAPPRSRSSGCPASAAAAAGRPQAPPAAGLSRCR